jgi:hypothetical protein
MNIRKLARFGSAAAAVVALSVTAGAATGTPAASGDPATPAITGVQAIVPGAAWSDQNGTLDQLHGVGMLKVGDTYYAYGEDKTNGGAFTAVACYSSKDLVTWHRGPDALSLQDSGDLGPGRVIERPKVLYNASTGQYVMWMHVDSSNSTPCGPYSYLGSSRPLGQLSRDLNLFEDTDGTGYLLSEDRNHGLRIDKLSPDYLSVVSTVAVLDDYEAPAMVKVDGTYYLFGSHLTGWNTNDNAYTTATSLAGPWSAWKNFAPAGTKTFDSQTSSIVPITGQHGTTYVYVGDRWYPSHLFDSAPIWLPMSISRGVASLNWVPSWTLDVAAGTWAPQIRSDEYEAGRPASELSDGATLVPCTGCSGESAVSGLGPGPVSYTYDDVDPALQYSAGWTHASNVGWAADDYNGTESFAQTAGATMSLDFTGSAVRVIGPKGPNGGIADISIDGAKFTSADTYAPAKQYSQVLFTDPTLSSGQHTLTVTVTGTKDAVSTDTVVSVDAVDLHATDQRTSGGGTLTFDDVAEAEPGRYIVQIRYVNPDVTDRHAMLTVDGRTTGKIAFPPTGGVNTTNVAVADLPLEAGSNTVVITQADQTAPEIDSITVAQPR